MIQFFKTTSTFDVSSFSIWGLVLGSISELLFVIQGVMKGSYTITITRLVTFLGFATFLIIWIIGKIKENETKN